MNIVAALFCMTGMSSIIGEIPRGAEAVEDKVAPKRALLLTEV